MFKPILAILAGALCSYEVWAQNVELQPDHPDQYVVERGDTLWDIADRFLMSPWLWPEIWQINPQIDNPHLIYPGDVISLVYIDGAPRLRVARGERPTVRLSPRARTTPLSEAIPPISINDIRPYLDKRTILAEEELAGLPYVIAIQENYLAGTEGHKIYVRGLDAEVGHSYAVVRPTVTFLEVPAKVFGNDDGKLTPKSREWSYPAERSITDFTRQFWQDVVMGHYYNKIQVLGYEVIQTAVGEVTATGDPASLLLTSGDIEVLPGDLVIPVFTADYDLEYVPHSPTSVPENTRIIALSRALFGAGRNQVVAINRGWAEGVEHGHVYATYREGRQMRDKVKYPRDDVKTYFSRERRDQADVKLPDEYSAHVMVFKTYEHVSYALIMRSRQAVKVLDLLKEP